MKEEPVGVRLGEAEEADIHYLVDCLYWMMNARRKLRAHLFASKSCRFTVKLKKGADGKYLGIV